MDDEKTVKAQLLCSNQPIVTYENPNYRGTKIYNICQTPNPAISDNIWCSTTILIPSRLKALSMKLLRPPRPLVRLGLNFYFWHFNVEIFLCTTLRKKSFNLPYLLSNV